MFLQTLGSLILVVCVSYHLVTASWQVVLLSFVVAGVGYATWIVRKAIIRRAKIKALWRRSIEIDEMLDTVSNQRQDQRQELKAERERRSYGRTRPVAFGEPARSAGSTGGGTDDNRTQTDSGVYPHVVREITTDPKARVYKFSMKALANSRVEKRQDQPIMV